MTYKQLCEKHTYRQPLMQRTIGHLRASALDCALAVEETGRKAALSLLERNPSARLLDLGCADGEFTMRLADRVGTLCVYGADAVPENVSVAQGRGIAAKVVRLDHDVPFTGESFDVITAIHVIEHVCDTDELVERSFALLKPGGYAIFATPNLAALHNIILLTLGRQPTIAEVSDVALVGSISPRGSSLSRLGPAHRRVFTAPAMTGLLRYYGFTVERSLMSGYYPFSGKLAAFLCGLDRFHASNIVVKARKPDAKAARTSN